MKNFYYNRKKVLNDLINKRNVSLIKYWNS